MEIQTSEETQTSCISCKTTYKAKSIYAIQWSSGKARDKIRYFLVCFIFYFNELLQG